MTNHTYLVTGGCGFLGQFIVKAIYNHNPHAQIRVLDLNPRNTLLNIESIPGVEIYAGDLRQTSSFIPALIGVETVIHSAGLISFKRGDDETLRQVNITGMENLLNAAVAQKCQNFVYISSISAIGQQPNHLSEESMVPDLEIKRQADPYGYSKLRGEFLLREKSDQIRSIILNPSVIVGPGSHRIAKTIHSLRWIPLCPTITTLNSFVDVRDVAEAVVLALENGRSGERYIVTTENVNMLSFMKMMMTFMGKKVPVFPVPKALLTLFDWAVWLLDGLRMNPGLKQSKGFNVDKAYSTQKINGELGWQPKYSVEQSLHEAISFYMGSQQKK
jgi:dihydroflavonol-4-reductase